MNLKDTLEYKINNNVKIGYSYKTQITYFLFDKNIFNINTWAMIKDNIAFNVDDVITNNIKNFIYFRTSIANSIPIKTSILNSFK